MEEPLQRSLERYDVLDRIAVGGMAEVFLAKAYGAHGFEKTLAIKRILPELASDPEFAARFIAEAKVAVRLSHANVVQVFDFGRIGESLFIAMEFVDGLDLAAMLRRFKDEHRQVPLPAAFHIAIEIIRALDFAHSHNVVHRDVSPSNILISRAGEVKIADFGIAIAASPHRGGGAGPRKVMGKWRYMSPEQARGDSLDTRSDLFSAASVMFELFTGDKLFPETISLRTDPSDPALTSPPFDSEGFPLATTRWIDKGTLTGLPYSRFWARKQGKPATGRFGGGRGGSVGWVLDGGSASPGELIKGVSRGVLITRFWYLRPVDPSTILVTGLTRDGTFLIENGAITRPVNNFRFNESPVQMLAHCDGLGSTSIPSGYEVGALRVPALRTHEFNLASISEAV